MANRDLTAFRQVNCDAAGFQIRSPSWCCHVIARKRQCSASSLVVFANNQGNVMKTKTTSRLTNRLTRCVALGAMASQVVTPVASFAADVPTKTPIKHVIVIIGENRTFDHIFATYQPVGPGETVDNLLSKHIINADGSPGPNYGAAIQSKAVVTDIYHFRPFRSQYAALPPALTGGPSTPYVCQAAGITTGTDCSSSSAALALAESVENGLPSDYYQYLLTGGTGQPSGVPDARINYDGHDASHLPPGPFQITSASFPYDTYAQSPVHRFYQMWQQLDCEAAGTRGVPVAWGQGGDQPSCAHDLFPWVEVTIGAGSNGKAQPPTSPTSDRRRLDLDGLLQRAAGRCPVPEVSRRHLCDERQLPSGGDRRHRRQSHHAGTGDAIWFSDGNGNPSAAAQPGEPGRCRRRPVTGTRAR